jgi:hypothetical protein
MGGKQQKERQFGFDLKGGEAGEGQENGTGQRGEGKWMTK